MIETKLYIPSTTSSTGCDVATQFERDLGIVLTIEERELICRLEAVRLSGVPPRVYVYDRGGIDSRQLLMRYFGWLDYDDNYAAVIAPSVAKAKKLTPPNGANLFSAANYDGVRSRAFTHVLILDANRRNYEEVLRAAVSGVPLIESTFVIIHSCQELSLPPAFIEPIKSAVRKAEPIGQDEATEEIDSNESTSTFQHDTAIEQVLNPSLRPTGCRATNGMIIKPRPPPSDVGYHCLNRKL